MKEKKQTLQCTHIPLQQNGEKFEIPSKRETYTHIQAQIPKTLSEWISENHTNTHTFAASGRKGVHTNASKISFCVLFFLVCLSAPVLAYLCAKVHTIHCI